MNNILTDKTNKSKLFPMLFFANDKPMIKISIKFKSDLLLFLEQ